MLEIERKFIVKNTTFLRDNAKCYQISQGYLNSNPERTVRIRIKNGKGFITVKGLGNESGTTRFEWEKEIPVAEAEALLQLCEDFIISKTRYEVCFEGKIFEVDIFHGKNEGLLLAEIELQNENDIFGKPEWIGEEVTGNEKYYNAYLSRHPFSLWH